MFYYPTHILKELLLGNLCDWKIVQNMSPDDSSLRIGSISLLLSQEKMSNSCDREIVQNMSLGNSSLRTSSFWLAFVAGENALDNQKCFIISHIVGWVLITLISCLFVEYIVKTTTRGAMDSSMHYCPSHGITFYYPTNAKTLVI